MRKKCNRKKIVCVKQTPYKITFFFSKLKVIDSKIQTQFIKNFNDIKCGWFRYRIEILISSDVCFFLKEYFHGKQLEQILFVQNSIRNEMAQFQKQLRLWHVQQYFKGEIVKACQFQMRFCL